MKSIFILIMSLMILPLTGSSQILKNIDEITPFHEEFAAVRKGRNWGFINTKGELVIEYRDDIVPSKTKNYPHFNDGRCLIKKMKDGILYFGYIDKTGKTIIEPQYLNALPFDQGYAIVLKIAKEELGKNDILDKKVVSYSYDEIIIDFSGNTKAHLTGPVHLIFSKDKLKKRPEIQSHFLSSHLIATKSKNSNWEIHTLDSLD